MTPNRILRLALGIVGLLLLALVLARGLERVMSPRRTAPGPSAAQSATPPAVPHITATLYYVTENADFLVPVRREVPLAEGPDEQGRQIVLEQLRPAAAPPLLSAVPTGTTLRAFYVTGRGEAFVDLSREVSAAHPGGSITELFTVYTIVNAVTANLPAISRVQILVDGKEVDTLAGHIDLRRPLPKNLSLVRPDQK
jgi:spore germination protein GerM